jgi:tetratricopeptide (TPR) repeat protein
VLLGLINTMQTVREVDIQPVLPRLFAYAECLEKRVELALAADVYGTIARLAEEEFDGDLLIDSFLRLGYCQRMLGALPDAETAYVAAGRIAKRQKETARALRSQIGIATVVMLRGNLPKAEELLASVTLECEPLGCVDVNAQALHVRSVVAQRRGDFDRAVCLAYEALKHTAHPSERDRILGDIGGYFIVMQRFDAARDALMILEATSAAEIVRNNARVNMVVLAARANDPMLFAASRSRLEGVTLPPESQVNYLIESARGFRQFGEPGRAENLLADARALAMEHGFNRAIFEAEGMLAERDVKVDAASGGARWEHSEAAASVEQELRTMALAVS